MQKNTCMKVMIIKKILISLITLIIAGCAISPGMQLNDVKTINGTKSVYIDTLDDYIEINSLTSYLKTQDDKLDIYKIGNGDQISITIWGLQEIFPLTNINAESNLRRVDSNGNIYFPYVGLIKASGKTQNELRSDISIALSESFNDPQLDVSIARFNSQKIYILGEVIDPKKINLTDIPLSLSDALGEVKGLNNNTSKGAEVFIIRQGLNKESAEIIKADLSSPTGFIDSGKFILRDNDIIYVNSNGTTRWNRVIAQFFPFSTFLNSVDRLSNN